MSPILRIAPVLFCVLAVSLAASRCVADEFRFVPDVTYLPRQRLKLDLYLPSRNPGDPPAPGLIWLHGNNHDKGEVYAHSACGFLASQGYVCASIDYGDGEDRVGNIRDAKNALRFLRVHAIEYHVDPNRLAVGGESMGGYLALMTGLTKGQSEYDPKQPYPGVSDAVTLIIDFYGFVETVRGTPLAYLRHDSPPILIIHGTGDPKIDYHQSIELEHELKRLGVPHQLILEKGAGHGFTLTDEKGKALAIDLRAPILAFARQYLGGAR